MFSIQRTKIRFITLFFAMSMSWFLCAENVMPEFSGEWFDYVIPDQTKYDSCCAGHFKYEHKLGKDALIALLFNLPPNSDCHWVGPFFDSYTTNFPADFPGNNVDLYNQVINSGGVKPEYWRAECINNRDPNYIQDSRGFVLMPSYRCPQGARSSCADGDIICSYKPSCMADVVGRDLDVLGLGWIGHIGLIDYGGDSILEVLNENPVLQSNSIGNFKKRTPFWGEVYGLDQSDFVDYDQAFAAVTAGQQQGQFDPEYTTTIFWREGRYAARPVYDAHQNRFLSERGIIRGKFRCDTFVNYCYMKGFGIQLPKQPALEILPRSTYNSFLFKRTNGAAALDNKNITETSIALLEDKIHAYVHDTHFSHVEKLNHVWDLAQQSDVHGFSHALDTLGALGAYEIVPTLIDAFHNETNNEKRKKLISAIADSVLSYAQQAHQGDILAHIHNTIRAQQFITNLLQESQDFVLLRHVLLHALSILPMNHENFIVVTQALDRLHVVNEISDKQKFLIALSMAFANDAMQEWLLPALLSRQLNGASREVFDEQLLFVISQLESSNVASAIKALLKEYLRTVQIKGATGSSKTAEV